MAAAPAGIRCLVREGIGDSESERKREFEMGLSRSIRAGALEPWVAGLKS